MPQQAPGTLTRAQAMDLDGLRPAVQQVSRRRRSDRRDGGAVHAACGQGGGARGCGGESEWRSDVTATANLAQFMRAVTFPNANIIFNTQLYDPGKEKPKMPIPYDYVLWGKTVYYGWEAVDEAILALRDTSPMLLLPGRKCQNGRPVPIQNADYQKAVKDLVAFTDELWKAAQTREPGHSQRVVREAE